MEVISFLRCELPGGTHPQECWSKTTNLEVIRWRMGTNLGHPLASQFFPVVEWVVGGRQRLSKSGASPLASVSPCLHAKTAHKPQWTHLCRPRGGRSHELKACSTSGVSLPGLGALICVMSHTWGHGIKAS